MSLLFKRALAEQVAAGEKTVTRRAVSENPRSPWFRERCRFQPGKSVAVLGGFDRPALCRVRIIAVEQMRLGLLSNEEAVREGFANAAVFHAVFEEISGGYDPDLEVWRLEFERGERADG